MTQSLIEQYPGGCFLGFNSPIDRKAAEQLLVLITQAFDGGFSRIHLMLHSLGGFVEDTHYLVEVASALPVQFITYNMSTVQSAAVMLYAMGAERWAAPGSTFFLHQTGFESVPGQRLSEVEITDKLRLIHQGDARSAQRIASRIGASSEDVLNWQKGNKSFDAEGAAQVGLVHRIGAPVIPPSAIVRQVIV